MTRDPKNKYDLDVDGIVSEEEVQEVIEIEEHELLARKQLAQRRMATAALVAMFMLTMVLLSDFISESRIKAISDLISTFYFAMAGIVGAYMGMSAWLAKK